MICKYCESDKVNKNGKLIKDNEVIGQRYYCKSCSREFSTHFIDEIINDPDNTNTQVSSEEKDNIKTVVFKGFKVPQNEKQVVEFYDIDLNVWFIDKLKFNSWGQENKLNKQCTVILKKIIPDTQQIPVVKKIEVPIKYKSKDVKKNNKIKTSIALGDMHIGFRRDLSTGKLNPFHDRTAINLTLNLIDYIKPDEIILAGDILDFPEMSKFLKEPEFYFTVQPGLIELSYLLQSLRNIVPEAKIVYMIGNHEHRLTKQIIDNFIFAYNMKKVNDSYSVLSLRNLLDLDSLDIDFIDKYPNGEYWVNNNLRIIHGEFVKITSELNSSKISTIMFHLHKIQKLFKTSHSRDGIDKMFVHVGGCLTRTDSMTPGKTRPDWQQGIVKVDTVNNKYFDSKDIVFHSGKAIYDGILFEGEDYTEKIEKIFKEKL